MAPAITPTGYALLGLLSFGRELSGYQLKQWADRSLRFFYASPPMSQVYAELQRLADGGYVLARETGRRRTRRFRISASGRRSLVRWLEEAAVEPPLLKHHPAFRVFLGHLVAPDVLVRTIEAHRDWCNAALAELAAVHDELGDDPTWEYPRLVADWGEAYYAGELDALERIEQALPPTREAPAGERSGALVAAPGGQGPHRDAEGDPDE